MSGESQFSAIEELSPSARAYVSFVGIELEEAGGSVSFVVHHPAPPDMTPDQLEYYAEALRRKGWRADVAAVESGEEALLGLRIRSPER